MPKKGPPTRLVRVYETDATLLAARADRGQQTVADVVNRLLHPPTRPVTAASDTRCTCSQPVLSKHATTICTRCGQRRP